MKEDGTKRKTANEWLKTRESGEKKNFAREEVTGIEGIEVGWKNQNFIQNENETTPRRRAIRTDI